MAAVAWQGITLKVPVDWSLVGVSGDDKKGYFRVDSPIASALEVRWSSALGRAPDLIAKGREFLSNLEKSCRKKKIAFSSKLRPNRDTDADDSVSFTWRADRLGQGCLLYCRGCDRVVIAQIISTRDENVSHVAPIILRSLRDHRDDGWVDWAMYGLEFAVPAAYKIEKQTLMSAKLSLSFKDKAKRLVVERWGLASTMLADEEDNLVQWYTKEVLPDIRGYRTSLENQLVRGHAGLKLTGRRAGIKQAVRAAGASLTLHPHAGSLTGYAWYCADSNRIFGVRATHVQGDDIAEQMRDLVECHRRKGNQ